MLREEFFDRDWVYFLTLWHRLFLTFYPLFFTELIKRAASKLSLKVLRVTFDIFKFVARINSTVFFSVEIFWDIVAFRVRDYLLLLIITKLWLLLWLFDLFVFMETIFRRLETVRTRSFLLILFVLFFDLTFNYFRYWLWIITLQAYKISFFFLFCYLLLE